MQPDSDPRFNDFVILQAQNAGLFLGQVPHPATGKKQVNLPAAHSVIDSLKMLETKTKGNLTESEDMLLKKAIENLEKLLNEVTIEK